MTDKAEFCVFSYMYRDASNYKARGNVILRGAFDVSAHEAIKAACDQGLYFIAEQVGLDALQGDLFAYSDGATEDDHPWHEYTGLERVEADSVREEDVWGTLADFLEAFKAVEDWDPQLATYGGS